MPHDPPLDGLEVLDVLALQAQVAKLEALVARQARTIEAFAALADDFVGKCMLLVGVAHTDLRTHLGMKGTDDAA